MSRSNVHFEGVEILPEESMTAGTLEHGVYQLVGPILPQILKQLLYHNIQLLPSKYYYKFSSCITCGHYHAKVAW